MNDQSELKELYALRATIDARIARLEQRRVLPVTRNGTITTIRTEDIRPYVQGWIDEGFPLQTLADKADLSVETLYHILRLDRQTVKETTADKILQALGIPHVYNSIAPEPPQGQYYEE